MSQFKYALMVLGVVVVMGAGCASKTTTTTSNTNVTNTTVVNATDVTEDEVDEVVDDTDVVVNTNTEPTTDATTTTTDVETTTTETTEVVEATTQTFDVTASQFSFDPATITVNQGDTVVLNITSTDVPHGFSLPEFDVNETLTPGKTKTVQFVADQVGTFNYSCSVVCGSGHSAMTGQLIVE